MTRFFTDDISIESMNSALFGDALKHSIKAHYGLESEDLETMTADDIEILEDKDGISATDILNDQAGDTDGDMNVEDAPETVVDETPELATLGEESARYFGEALTMSLALRAADKYLWKTSSRESESAFAENTIGDTEEDGTDASELENADDLNDIAVAPIENTDGEKPLVEDKTTSEEGDETVVEDQNTFDADDANEQIDGYTSGISIVDDETPEVVVDTTVVEGDTGTSGTGDSTVIEDDTTKVDGGTTSTESEATPEKVGIVKKFWTWLKTIFEKIRTGIVTFFKKIQIWLAGDMKKYTSWYSANAIHVNVIKDSPVTLNIRPLNRPYKEVKIQEILKGAYKTGLSISTLDDTGKVIKTDNNASRLEDGKVTDSLSRRVSAAILDRALYGGNKTSREVIAKEFFHLFEITELANARTIKIFNDDLQQAIRAGNAGVSLAIKEASKGDVSDEGKAKKVAAIKLQKNLNAISTATIWAISNHIHLMNTAIRFGAKAVKLNNDAAKFRGSMGGVKTGMTN